MSAPHNPEAEEATMICTNCSHEPHDPYRRTVGGEVVEGCISSAHNGHADAWHLRPAAVATRAKAKAWADMARAR
jgi:hypothetical protein